MQLQSYIVFSARHHIAYARSLASYMLSPVRPSVCHTGWSYKTGWR